MPILDITSKAVHNQHEPLQIFSLHFRGKTSIHCCILQYSNAEKMWTCTHFLMWISSCYSKVRNGSCLTFIWLEIELLPKKLDSESKSCLSSVKQGRQSRPDELKDEFLYDCNWRIPFLAPIHAGQVAVGQWEFTATPSLGHLQLTLHTLNYEKCQTTGISAPCCEIVKGLGLVMCFQERLSNEGVWCWTEKPCDHCKKLNSFLHSMKPQSPVLFLCLAYYLD